MRENVNKKLIIENFLQAISEMAEETENKLIIEWTKDLVLDICNEYGLCKKCHAEITSAIFDGSYMVTSCECSEKITRYA